MATTNAFALLSTEASDSKIVNVEKKKEPKKKAPKKNVPAQNPKDVKAPAPVRGSKVPDAAIEQKRGGIKPSRKPLEIKRTGNRPPKRQFDRKDGTGRAHEGPKKKGAGRGNWGKVTDYAEGNTEQPKEEEKPEEPVLSEEEKALKELREKQRTLDQYQKEHKGEKTILRSKAAVEVECSVDEKNFAPLQRVDLVAEQEKAIAAEKPKKAEKAEKPKKATPAPKKEEQPTIEIKFNEGRREREHHERAKQAKVNVAQGGIPCFGISPLLLLPSCFFCMFPFLGVRIIV